MKKFFLLFALVVSTALSVSCARILPLSTIKDLDSDCPEWSKREAFWTIDLGQEGWAVFAVGKSNGQNASKARVLAEEAAMREIVLWFKYVLNEDVDTNWLRREDNGARAIRSWRDETENTTFVWVAYLLSTK